MAEDRFSEFRGGVSAKPEKSIKVMQETTKMYKEARKSAPAIQETESAFAGMNIAMGGLNVVMQALEPIISIITPIFEIIGALFQAMGGAIASELLPVLQPLFEALISLMPVFVEIGTTIGALLAPILGTLIDIFISFMPIIQSVLGLLVPLIELAFVPLKLILDIISPLLEGLSPLFDTIADALDLLEVPLGIITNILEVVLLGALKIAAFSIAIFIDAITLGFAGAVNFVAALFNSLNDVIEESPVVAQGPITIVPIGAIPPRGAHGMLDRFQEGIDSVRETGPAIVHRGEAIQPSGQVALQVQLLTEIRDIQREVMLEARWKHNRSRTAIRG